MNKIKSFILKHRKAFTIGLCTSLAAALTVGATFAFLISRTEKVSNTVTPGTVTNKIVEEFDGNVKENVSIQNTGSIASYIRVKIVPTWENSDEEVMALSASLSDLTISFNSNNDWIVGNDGYYYYKNKVNAGDSTTVLIKRAEVLKTSAGYKKGYNMNLEILAESIQGDPPEAVKTSWNRTVDENGKLS